MCVTCLRRSTAINLILWKFQRFQQMQTAIFFTRSTWGAFKALTFWVTKYFISLIFYCIQSHVLHLLHLDRNICNDVECQVFAMNLQWWTKFLGTFASLHELSAFFKRSLKKHCYPFQNSFQPLPPPPSPYNVETLEKCPTLYGEGGGKRLSKCSWIHARLFVWRVWKSATSANLSQDFCPWL